MKASIAKIQELINRDEMNYGDFLVNKDLRWLLSQLLFSIFHSTPAIALHDMNKELRVARQQMEAALRREMVCIICCISMIFSIFARTR